MGLDMYYYARTKNKLNTNEFDGYNYCSFFENDKVDRTNYPEDLKELGDYILKRNFKSSFMEEDGSYYYQIGYFRKFNALHKYMCDLDGGRDECQDIVLTKDNIKELYDLLNTINHNHSKAPELLPVQEGFFFGSYEYDDWYFYKVNDAIKMCELFLEYFNFDKYDLFYHASW